MTNQEIAEKLKIVIDKNAKPCLNFNSGDLFAELWLKVLDLRIVKSASGKYNCVEGNRAEFDMGRDTMGFFKNKNSAIEATDFFYDMLREMGRIIANINVGRIKFVVADDNAVYNPTGEK